MDGVLDRAAKQGVPVGAGQEQAEDLVAIERDIGEPPDTQEQKQGDQDARDRQGEQGTLRRFFCDRCAYRMLVIGREFGLQKARITSWWISFKLNHERRLSRRP